MLVNMIKNHKNNLILTIITVAVSTIILIPFFNNVVAFPPNPIDLSFKMGKIVGVVKDNNAKDQWILTGIFKASLLNMTQSGGNVSAIFTAPIEMIKVDGTAKHTHSITNFVLSSISNPNSTTKVFNGTSTINMKEIEITEVPTSITSYNNTLLSIWLDPSKLDIHFGDSKIYGIVEEQIYG